MTQLPSSVPTGLFIGGQWRDASNGGKFVVEDPATGQVLAEVADATPEDGMAALDAAAAVQESWARTAPRVRGELLRAGFEAVTARAEEFAQVMTLEMGKPLAESRGEVAYGAEFLRWFSEEAVRIYGRYSTAPDGVNRLLVTKRPVGPSLLITPWNFPLAMATRKVAPAMAAGCTVVVKPAALTPLTTLLFAKVMEEAGVPAGVINVIPTSRSGATTAPLFADSRLRKVSFTGSTEVGRVLLKQAADGVLRTSMELGGNAPFLVFSDADLNAAVDGAYNAKLRNGGQACTAANRIYVHSGIAEEFSEKLAARVAGIQVGPGIEDGTQLGPVIDDDALVRIGGLVDEAVATGGKVLTGGHRMDRAGHFFEPTVLVNVPREARVLTEEIFGPVVPISTFDTEDEAIELANSSEYGLISYVFTKNLARALRLGERIETGMLAVNAGVISNPAAPFGGVKQSGLGREGGEEGIEEYLETVYIGIGNPYAS
ncbi:MAG: NAD-dependent succinate-semialdehyde dehydrogenase [Actinobacteria bacterium]|nr:NAD-dependent succinate-semialdehyde dehydrogenase [Actinomycetota bacterium]MBU4206154.1 NAD-dependent succinate-semialdehyde dehydrogenase [Actinomycetota bacterium]MBU4251206.1 NAD-dependent succinate-semialdehyde dehydrogenase [Actinomycetota bacterium]MBU4363180.1 NAD-dependent succinate-semialdehyde dehydrogenase [Actinomycetota bacterium]MBU4410987.1 NAD-dependent succinate-semialdehyde dehydrogenase [Actinomycetota bacterium]